MVKLPIYMDNHATTPVDPRVLEAMLPYFTEKFGNAASRNHSFGWEAEEAVDKARNQIAALIDAKSKEIIFTSGATESDNLAIKGVVEFYKDKGNHIITCVTEHKAVLDSCRTLERDGQGDRDLSAGRQVRDGRPRRGAQRRSPTRPCSSRSCTPTTRSARFIRLREIGTIAKEKGIIFHCDAVQAVGKIPVDVERDGIDLLVDERAQDLRTQGRRRALRPRQGTARAPDAA